MKKTFISILLALTICALQVGAMNVCLPIEQQSYAADLCDECNIYMSELCGGNFVGYGTASCGITSHGDGCEVALTMIETYRRCSSCGAESSASPHVHGYEHSYDGVYHQEECVYSSAVASIDPAV